VQLKEAGLQRPGISSATWAESQAADPTDALAEVAVALPLADSSLVLVFAGADYPLEAIVAGLGKWQSIGSAVGRTDMDQLCSDGYRDHSVPASPFGRDRSTTQRRSS